MILRTLIFEYLVFGGSKLWVRRIIQLQYLDLVAILRIVQMVGFEFLRRRHGFCLDVFSIGVRRRAFRSSTLYWIKNGFNRRRSNRGGKRRESLSHRW